MDAIRRRIALAKPSVTKLIMMWKIHPIIDNTTNTRNYNKQSERQKKPMRCNQIQIEKRLYNIRKHRKVFLVTLSDVMDWKD